MGQGSSYSARANWRRRTAPAGSHRSINSADGCGGDSSGRRLRGHQRLFACSTKSRELSETFNMTCDDGQLHLLNINLASEEELMTLPGINRTTARNIVQHRQAIGGQFRKVEDLALVSGVGANKLSQIRSELCVSSSKKRGKASSVGGSQLSRSSSCTTAQAESELEAGVVDGWAPLPSPVERDCGGSLPLRLANGHCSRTLSGKPVDVNSANMFELMTVHCIDQSMAAAILHHRDKKGPYRTVDDLAKVKGLNYRMLGELRRYMCVNPETLAAAIRRQQSTKKGSGSTHQNSCSGRMRSKHRHRRNRRASSVPPAAPGVGGVPNGDVAQPKHANLESQSSVGRTDDEDSLIYETLASHCPRPAVVDRFIFRRDGQPALRLATWNLERFTPEKVQNLGVVEVVCRTILENGISIIALQDLADRLVLDKICSELNSPTLKNVQDWVGPRGAWQYRVSEVVSQDGQPTEYIGFLYDTNRHITATRSETLAFSQPNNNGPDLPGAFYVTFRAENIEFSVLSVHLPFPTKVDQTDQNQLSLTPMENILNEWLERVKDTVLLIVLGDFNCDSTSVGVRVLHTRFSHLVPAGETTGIGSEEPGSPNCFSNIWISHWVKRFYTGHFGVIRKGLWHLAIPKGWNWGGYATSHCPVWAEFYVPSLVSLVALSDQVDTDTVALKVTEQDAAGLAECSNRIESEDSKV